jgi:hypothetical protein
MEQEKEYFELLELLEAKEKRYKAIYSKEFVSDKEHAVDIATLLQPEFTELVNVIEADQSPDLLTELGEMFNPKKQ